MNTATEPHRIFLEQLGQLTGAGQSFEIEQRQIDGKNYKMYKNAPRSLRELLDQGRAHGDKEFLLYEGEHYTFTEFFRQADAVSCSLAANGIQAGDRVAIAMRNYPEWMMAFVAIATIGAIPVTINSWGTVEEMLYVIDDSQSRLVFCDDRRQRMLTGKLQQRSIDAVVARPGEDSTAVSWQDYVLAGGNGEPPRPELSGSDPALLIYTSGTTGKPKGVLSLHRQVCQAIYNFECCGMAMAISNGDLLMKLLEQGDDYAALLAVPLFHVSGCFAVFILNLRSGRRTVMMYKWDVDRALQYIGDEKIGILSVAPSMLMSLFESDNFARTDTSRLYFIGGGGSSFPSTLPKLIDRQLPDRIPGCGYGSTETNASACSMNGHMFRARPQASGLPSPIIEIQIRDKQNIRELPRGEIGEICIFGVTIAQCYWNKPQTTAETFVDRWYRSGDLGYIDDDGYLHIVDRIKDIVVKAGENISSIEVENAIASCADIAEAAVFGMPHDRLGEEIAAVAVVRDGRQVEQGYLKEYLSQRLAHYKVPDQLFIRSEPLPRNPTGKILKNTLRQQYNPKPPGSGTA